MALAWSLMMTDDTTPSNGIVNAVKHSTASMKFWAWGVAVPGGGWGGGGMEGRDWRVAQHKVAGAGKIKRGR
jgi:hypothetical protein